MAQTRASSEENRAKSVCQTCGHSFMYHRGKDGCKAKDCECKGFE
jgi:hypothetical protein